MTNENEAGLQQKTRTAIARLRQHAAAAHGMFSAAEAGRYGLSRQLLRDLGARELIVRLERGLYAFVPYEAIVDRLAAWRKVGSDSVLSHTSALAAWDLSDVEPRSYELTVPRAKRARARQHGPLFRLHTASSPPAVHWIQGVPVTSPARSIVDAATSSPISGEQIEMAVAQAIGRGLATEEDLLAELRRRPAHVRASIERALVVRDAYAGYV
jgi:predicted transcriptional regulator of viral defense system